MNEPFKVRGKIEPEEPPPPEPLTEAMFAGCEPEPSLTCCDDCQGPTKERPNGYCVITKTGFCGHPKKGELQSSMQNNHEIVVRRRFVKRMLERMKLEARAP